MIIVLKNVGTFITAGSGTIRDAEGIVWSITSGGQISRNSIIDTTTQGKQIIKIKTNVDFNKYY